MWFLGGAGLLMVAAWVAPDPSGVGTHMQLGLPPCSMMLATGLPCPTCGMTTAFAHAVRGYWLTALHTQPAGFVGALAFTVFAAINAATVVTGRKWLVNWYRVRPGRLGAVLVAIVLAAWVYRIGATLGVWP